MNEETPEVTEVIEPPLSEVDAADVAKLNDEEPEHRTVLEIWNEVLAGGASEKKARVSPAWASSICARFPQMKIQEFGVFHEKYFEKIDELHQILIYELGADDQALKRRTVKTDAEHNRVHYINIITLWQAAVMQWELNWDFADEHSHIELAAISEAHKFFFGGTGLIAQLDVIEVRFTEDDQNELVAYLEEFKDGHE
jgi:hypothetical protein